MSEQLQDNAPITVLKAHLDKELDRIASHAQWYKEHALRVKRKYFAVRIPIIVLGTLLPSIIAIQMTNPNNSYLSVITFITASIVAVLTGLDTFLRYGETWAEERAAELALYALRRKYRREMLRIEYAPSMEKAVEIAEAVIDS